MVGRPRNNPLLCSNAGLPAGVELRVKMMTMTRWSVLVAAVVAASTGKIAADEPRLPVPQLVYQAAFEEAAPLDGWAGPGRVEAGYQGGHAVRLEADQAARGATIQRDIPVASLRGCTLRCVAMVKAAGVSAAPQPWNGIKFMLVITTPDGRQWPQAPLETGTFDWRRAAFNARIPTNATALTLCLGLEQVTGSVWFDELRLTVAKRAPVAKPQPPPATGPIFTGHSQPRLRGAMVGPQIDEAGLRVLGQEWKANLVRWQLIRPGRAGVGSSLADYDAWLEGELKRLDRVLPWCEKYGLRVALDLHSPPGGKGTAGGYVGTDGRLFTDRKVQDHFVELWGRIAKRYKGAKAIWGYDLANEPVEEFVEEGCDDWHGLAERAAQAIREIDPERALIVEAPPWGSPESLADFTPIATSNVVYSVHMYVPMAFTHQGVFGPLREPVVYPGVIEGQRWDKMALARVLQPVVEFQKAYHVQIYIGEFSAIRWAPGESGAAYLRDLSEIFEEHGWDWSYHAFREWPGWSVEHSTDRKDETPTPAPGARQLLLREWYGKNGVAWGRQSP
jgi:endoglucanase